MWFPLVVSVVMGAWMARAGKEADSGLAGLLYPGDPLALDKRAAYTYVSEYKRLPIYNFGLGKRGGGAPADAELQYQLGKRDPLQLQDYDLKDDYKRVKQYSFGLGKRLPMKTYSFGLGKRMGYEETGEGDDDLERAYEEEAKRGNGPGQRFGFGLGKRGDGKSDFPERRSMQYNFGLGKRSSLSNL